MPYVLIAFGGVVLLAIAAFALLWKIAPTCHVVHAAHAKPIDKEADFKWGPIRLVRDENGRIVPLASTFLGCTDGDSMKPFGIPNGSRFVANRLQPGSKVSLAYEDIVVVNGKAAKSKSGYRLRRIDRIDGDQAFFLKDGKGYEHRPRPLAEVVAKVAYVL